MKDTIKKLQNKIDELVVKVPDTDYLNANSIKTLSSAILDLTHAEKMKAETDCLKKQHNI